MHQNSMKLMKYFRDNYLLDMPTASILDVGSKMVRGGRQMSYRRLFKKPFQYTGMDIESGRNVDIVGYENIPKMFDVVISGQVMEHVKYPWEWLENLKKYFKHYICIIAPNTSKEHRYPIDTFRYFPDGMRSLFEWTEIEEIEIFKSLTDTIGIGVIGE